MGFFGMGGGEILLILIVALVIWGPNKLPEIAQKLGRIVRTLRKASFDLTNTVTKELDVMDSKSKPSKTPNPTSQPPTSQPPTSSPPASQPPAASAEAGSVSATIDGAEAQPEDSQTQNPERQQG